MSLSEETLQSHRKSLIFHLSAMAGLIVLGIAVLMLQRSGASRLLLESPGPVLRYLFYAAAVVAIFTVRLLHNALIRRALRGHPQKILNRLQKASLWTAALCEIPALLGFMFFLLTGTSRDFYFLLILSLILFFMYFPKKIQWQTADGRIRASRT